MTEEKTDYTTRFLDARLVYSQAYANTESFKYKTIGACLAYLLGAILEDSRVGYYLPLDDEEDFEVKWLLDTYDENSVVWKYIELVGERCGNRYRCFQQIADRIGYEPEDDEPEDDE